MHHHWTRLSPSGPICKRQHIGNSHLYRCFMTRSAPISSMAQPLALTLAWVALVLLIGPWGDFPLNDDWCYAKSVQTLVETGQLKLYNWGEMTLVAHVYWGALFAKLFGFSFTVLRVSTLVMGLAAVLGTRALCKAAGMSGSMSTLGAALLMLNPVFLDLSFSFMTDVPFTAIVVWACYCFVRAYQSGRILLLVLGIALTGWAFLIRQLALVLPLAWLAGMLIAEPRNTRNLVQALLPTVMLAMLYFGYSYGMQAAGLLQERYNDKLGVLAGIAGNLTLKRLINIPGYVVVSLSYLGLFLLPLALFTNARAHWQRWKWPVLGSLVVLTGVLIATGKTIPTLDNVLIDTGVGPTTLPDHYGNFTESPAPHAPAWIWRLVTAAGVLGAIGLLLPVLPRLRSLIQRKKLPATWVFALAFVGIYMAPFMVVGIYDRYLITIMPLALVLTR